MSVEFDQVFEPSKLAPLITQFVHPRSRLLHNLFCGALQHTTDEHSGAVGLEGEHTIKGPEVIQCPSRS